MGMELVQEVVTAFGAYYQDSGQNKKNLLTRLTQGSVTPSFMTPIKTDDEIYRMSVYDIGSIVQPFTTKWTPSTPGVFTPNEIRKRRIKIDLDLYPDILKGNWLGFLAAQGLDKKDCPFVKYLTEEYLINRLHSDMETLVYYNGVYKAIEGDTPGVSADVLDGINIQLQRGVDTDKINILTNIGALDKTTVFDQVEAAIDLVSDVYQGIEMMVCMAPVYARAYLRDKRSQGFYQINSDKQVDLGIDFSPSRVVPLPSMGKSTDLFITPKANLLHITDQTLNKGNFKIEESKRQVSILSDWSEGIGIGINEAVWTNKAKTPTSEG